MKATRILRAAVRISVGVAMRVAVRIAMRVSMGALYGFALSEVNLTNAQQRRLAGAC